MGAGGKERGRSGLLLATNDAAIEELVNDPNYEILPDGRIFSLVGGRRELGSNRSKGGRAYRIVRVKKHGPLLSVHRIIYRKFKGPLAEDLVVRHLDDNGLNNHIDNLALGTQSENLKDRFKHSPAVAGHRKITPEIAAEVLALHEAGLSYRQILEITKPKYGWGTKSGVSYIVNKKTWAKETVLSPTAVTSTYNELPRLTSTLPSKVS